MRLGERKLDCFAFWGGWGEKKLRVQMCVNEQKRDLLITSRSKVYES